MEIKDIIRNRRLEMGLTMKQVAEAVGVNEGTVSRWESGNIENMRRDPICSRKQRNRMVEGKGKYSCQPRGFLILPHACSFHSSVDIST